jgi:hypothetical protein
MKDYIRRSAKFIIYVILIFVIILGIIPLIGHGKPLTESMRDMIHNSRFTFLFVLLFAYAMVYPMITFIKVKRHLNGTFAENRDKFERAFASLNYVKVEEMPDRVVYRKRSHFSRILQWYEDKITVFTTEDPLIISGFRKWVMRIDRIIDQYLLKESE